MLKIATFLFWALTVWSLWQESVALDFESEYLVCLLDEPNPNEDSLCLNDLRPLLIETKAKLDELQGQQVKMEGRLEAKVAKIEGQLLTVQNKVEAKMTKIETQLQTLIDKINANQPAIGTIPQQAEHEVPSGFEEIDKKYFHFFEDLQDLFSAINTCHRKGGDLATIENQEEEDAIREKIEYGVSYWIRKCSRFKLCQFVVLDKTGVICFEKYETYSFICQSYKSIL